VLRNWNKRSSSSRRRVPFGSNQRNRRFRIGSLTHIGAAGCLSAGTISLLIARGRDGGVAWIARPSARPTFHPHRKAAEADEARLTPSAFSVLRTTTGVLSRAKDGFSNQLVGGRGAKDAFLGRSWGLASQVTPPARLHRFRER
jgi:hypothetical protein